MMMIHQKILRTAEMAFIDTVRDHVKWSAVQSAVKQRFDMDVHENVKYISGALTVCQGQVAVRFDFDLEIKFSLFIGCDGQLLAITAPEGQEMIPDAHDESASGFPPGLQMDERTRTEVQQTATELDEMIKKING